MKFPLVTRAHHDEIVQALKEECARERKERREWMDYALRMTVGRGFTEEIEEPTPVVPAANGMYFTRPLGTTPQAVKPTARERLRQKQRELDEEYLQGLNDTTQVNPDASEEIQRTIEEGYSEAAAPRE